VRPTVPGGHLAGKFHLCRDCFDSSQAWRWRSSSCWDSFPQHLAEEDPRLPEHVQ